MFSLYIFYFVLFIYFSSFLLSLSVFLFVSKIFNLTSWIMLTRATLKCLFDNFNISVISELTSIGIFLPCKVLRFPAPVYDQKFCIFGNESKSLIENIDLCVLAGWYGQQPGSYIPEGCGARSS